MSQDTMSDLKIEITRHYSVGRETVFKMWTDPEHLKRWFSPTKEILVPTAEVDLKVGGKYRIGMQTKDKGTKYVGGVYTEIEAPGKLAFTWAWEDWAGGVHDGKETLVTIVLHDKDGGTELVLTHERIPDQELKDRHNEGWLGCLSRLDELCIKTAN